MSYELGGVLEPAVGAGRRSDWPLMVWHRVEGAALHDGEKCRWFVAGDHPRLWLRPDSPADSAGEGAPALHASFAGTAPDRYQRAVARGVEYIRAGDVYQVNLAHTLEGRLAAPPRAFARALMERAGPWYGAYIEHAGPDGRGRAVCSASPELFLEVAPVAGRGQGRRIVTRPMKGTLSGDADPGLLAGSAKDRAELDMIVDLMRNDLGRVCQTGSVRVEDRRTIERHGMTRRAGRRRPSGGVWQGVATVAGELRAGAGLVELLRAVFPAGSITGAPKIRAMQIIEELEGRPRGAYCGCVGFIGDDGRVGLNVAIRTALLEPGVAAGADPAAALASPDWLASWSVGAGIVADSDPAREWDETMQKAQAFLGLSANPAEPVSGYVIADAP
jgi:para-aminobenzoate synthetase component 1